MREEEGQDEMGGRKRRVMGMGTGNEKGKRSRLLMPDSERQEM